MLTVRGNIKVTGNLNLKTAVTQAGIVADGLVLHLDAGNASSYPGSGTTWTDLTGNGNNGTLTNGAVYDSGDGGKIDFDGTNDYVNIGDKLSAPTAISISGWINPDAGSEFPFLQKGIGKAGNREYGLYMVANKVYGTVADESAGDVDSVYGTTALTGGIWYNIGMSWDGSTLIVYLNGLAENSVSTSVSEIEDLSSSLTIAKDAGNDYGNGQVSQVLMYNRALSAAEFLNNYNAIKSRYGL